MITKDTLIIDALQMGDTQKIADVFFAAGMGCLHCALAHGESIEDACKVHGINPDELIAQLNAVI